MEDLKQAIFELLGLEIDPAQEEAFARFASELAAWNQRFNLTAISDPAEVQVKHFLDSLSCWLALRTAPAERVIDLGSGAGFPGLPLKILEPGLRLSLVESVGKKAAFLRHMVQDLGLKGVEVLNQRAEEVGQTAGQRESYDWALARALAPMPALVEYLLPLVKLGGFALAQKGPKAAEEVEEAERAIRLLGGGEARLERVEVPGLGEERYLVVIEKVGPTPEKYPRRAGVPGKRPLG
jgi:16S rRNA (guanine527-N7)-methyltransferase